MATDAYGQGLTDGRRSALEGQICFRNPIKVAEGVLKRHSYDTKEVGLQLRNGDIRTMLNVAFVTSAGGQMAMETYIGGFAHGYLETRPPQPRGGIMLPQT